MVRVFISHAADDDVGGQRDRLAADLRAAGVDVWMSPGSIEPGEPFSAAIDRGLESSEFFVVLLSPASLASRWVQTEVNAAIDRALRGEIQVLPVVVRPVAVPPLLSAFQQIDLTRYGQGLTALGNALGVPLHPVAGAAGGPRGRPGRKAARRPPPDAFVATVLGDLDRSARRFGYLVSRAPAEPESIVDSIVEVALLRIGVAVWPPGAATPGRILAEVERELLANPHRVAGMLAICSGSATTLTPYQLLDAPTPNAMLLEWDESDGSDAVGASIDLVTQHLTGQAPTVPRRASVRLAGGARRWAANVRRWTAGRCR